MAFRRSAPSRGRSFRPRSRFSRNRTHQPRRTGFWQRANLMLIQENVVDNPGAHFNSVIVIGRVANLSRDDDEGGKARNQQIRFLEIGGIVFDWQMELSDIALDFTTTPETDIWRIENQVLLVSDRLDEEANPVAIDTNWFSSTSPIPLASAAAAEDEDQEFPTRVHWRHGRTIAGGYSQFPDVTGNYQPSQNQVSLQGSANLRLRLKLDDEHCLAFHWTSLLRNTSATLAAAAINLNIWGSLYYRVVF